MFAIGALLMLVSYIFGVMFTQLFQDMFADGHTDQDYFGRLDGSLFTLFQIMTLDNWATISRQLVRVPGYEWAWLPIIVFVIIAGFVVVNLVIAVICDAVAALHDDDRAKLHGNYEENAQDESEETRQQPRDMKEHLEQLDEQADRLARLQEESLKALEILTMRLDTNPTVLSVPRTNSSSVSTHVSVPRKSSMRASTETKQ